MDNKGRRESPPETSRAKKPAEVAHSTRVLGLNEYTWIPEMWGADTWCSWATSWSAGPLQTAMSMLMNSTRTREIYGRHISEVLLAHGLQIAWGGAFEKAMLKSRLRQSSEMLFSLLITYTRFLLSTQGGIQGRKDHYVEEQIRKLPIGKFEASGEDCKCICICICVCICILYLEKAVPD